MANPDCGAVTREPPKPQYEPNQSTATRFKRCMIDRCPQCLQCRRILQRVKPRSFAFDKAHTRPSPGRCACRRPPRRGRVPRAASPFRSPSRRPGRGHWLTRREYVDVTREELEAVAIESKRTIEIEQFVPKTQIDESGMVRGPTTSRDVSVRRGADGYAHSAPAQTKSPDTPRGALERNLVSAQGRVALIWSKTRSGHTPQRELHVLVVFIEFSANNYAIGIAICGCEHDHNGIVLNPIGLWRAC